MPFFFLASSSSSLLFILLTYLILALVCGVLTFFLIHYSKEAKEEAGKGTRNSEFLSMLLDSKDPKVIKKKKIFKILSNVLFYALLIIFIPVFLYSLTNRITHNKMPIGDKRVRVVASGSRSYKNEKNDYLVSNGLDNQFDKSDRIVVTKVKSESSIHLYDVLAYENRESGRTIIHRVIGRKEVDGKRHYTRRGDANDASDSYDLTFEDVVGVYSGGRVKKIGAIVLFLQSPIGIGTFISVLYSRLRIDFVSSKRDKVSESYRKEREKKVIYPSGSIEEVTFYLADEKVTRKKDGNRSRVKEDYDGPIRETYQDNGKEIKIRFTKEEQKNA